MEPLYYNRFTSYSVSLDENLATVPESELQRLITFANLAQAAVPAQCNHPAISLRSFDLIMDCCVCGECGAVLKDYSPREAQVLGIQPGWTKLDVELLEAELRKVLKPAIDLLGYIHSETGRYSGCREVMDWGDSASGTEAFKKLDKVR